MTHTTHITPLDLRPTGHVPFVVQAAEATRERADELATDGAREHTEPAASVCVYCKVPAVAVRTGQTGQRYGLCADCETAHESSVAAEAIITEGFRTKLAENITATARAYAHQGDDERPSRLRAFDIPRAARAAAEDAEVQVNLANQQADPHCRPVRSETETRMNVRLGTLLADAIPGLFESYVAAARERGKDPKRAVAELSGWIASAVVESGRDALKARA